MSRVLKHRILTKEEVKTRMFLGGVQWSKSQRRKLAGLGFTPIRFNTIKSTGRLT